MSPVDIALSRVLYRFADRDVYTARMACESGLITGSPGAGKSSTSGKQFALALLKAGYGGLVLTAKVEETRNWIGYARLADRESDLIIFSADSGHAFDPIFYDWHRPGRGSTDLEAVIDFFTTLITIGKPQSQGATSNENRFFELAAEQLMRNVLVLLSLADEPISIARMHEVIQSLPTRPGEFEEPEFQGRSEFSQLLDAIKQHRGGLSEHQVTNLDNAAQFACYKWPNLDPKTRSSIEMTWAGMADKFLFEPLRSLFCGGRITIAPELVTHHNRIIVIDFPMLEYGHETGRLINVMIKLAFQRALLRRNFEEVPNVAFIWQDECQFFLHRRENSFIQAARSAGIASFYLTQNLLNIAEELGEHLPGSKTKSFVGNLALKVFHQQNETETANYAADLIGKEWRMIAGTSNSDTGGGGTSLHSQLVHIVEPVEFTRLAKPDDIRTTSEAIVYLGGQPFEENGCSYLRIPFSRDIG